MPGVQSRHSWSAEYLFWQGSGQKDSICQRFIPCICDLWANQSASGKPTAAKQQMAFSVCQIDGAHAFEDSLDMKFARIRFKSRDGAVKAYYALARRSKVISLPQDQFIVAQPALEWLEKEHFSPTVLEWLNQDEVLQAIRNPAAHSL